MRGFRNLMMAVVMAVVIAMVAGTPAHAAGAWMFGASAGAAVPMGDFGDAFNAGFDGSVYADYGVSEQFAIGFEAGGNFHKANDDFHAALNSLTVAFLLAAGASTASSDLEVKVSTLRFGLYGKWMPSITGVKPFVEAGAGLYRLGTKIDGTVTADGSSQAVDESDSETKAGIQGGAGIMFAASPSVSLGARGQFHNVFTDGESTQFFSVAAIVQFMSGGQ